MNCWTHVKAVLQLIMRPLHHPAAGDITVEGVLYALSDPVRARIFASIAGSREPCTCSNFRQLQDRTLPKSTLSQHFKVLREAGLVRSERKGVEMHNTTRCAELCQRFGPLIESILKAYAASVKPAKRSKKRPA
jgi:DNA-binding transcriptional ArsR family regulator